MSNALTPSQDRAYKLMYFQEFFHRAYQVTTLKDLPFDKVEYVMKIFSEKDDFLFNDSDERLNDLLLQAACFYATFKSNLICYISPTAYYAQQALYHQIRILQGLRFSKALFPIVVPGGYGFSESVKTSQVIFMHGLDFTKYFPKDLPKDWSGRKIIQIFPHEEVPVDPIWRRQGCHDAE